MSKSVYDPGEGGSEIPPPRLNLPFKDVVSLRDWFAGQALCGMLHIGTPDAEFTARAAYAIADAMLAQRDT